MSGGAEGKGSCLCGAVSFKAHNIKLEIGACHCSMCRKWGGGPFMTIDCGSDVDFEDIETISVFTSSDWAERGFCSTCGTHLFYRLRESRQHFMPAGLLDIEGECTFDHQVFIDEKPAYYEFVNETRNMTGAEVFALYAPDDNGES